jgi:hypothetical protein
MSHATHAISSLLGAMFSAIFLRAMTNALEYAQLAIPKYRGLIGEGCETPSQPCCLLLLV